MDGRTGFELRSLGLGSDGSSGSAQHGGFGPRWAVKSNWVKIRKAALLCFDILYFINFQNPGIKSKASQFARKIPEN